MKAVKYKTNILEIAKKQDMSIEEIANTIGVHKSTIYSLVSQGKGSIKLLLEVAYVLDYPVRNLIDLNGEHKKELERRLWDKDKGDETYERVR